MPYRIRQTLNVESGLNDGIATPIVTVALAAIAAEAGIQHEGGRHAMLGLLLGALLGAVLGALGGILLHPLASVAGVPKTSQAPPSWRSRCSPTSSRYSSTRTVSSPPSWEEAHSVPSLAEEVRRRSTTSSRRVVSPQ